jgi:hypothetical protein
MKKELFIMAALVYSEEHEQLGTVTDTENPTIQNKAGENLEVNIEECREATTEEIESWKASAEEVVEEAVVEENAPLAENQS